MYPTCEVQPYLVIHVYLLFFYQFYSAKQYHGHARPKFSRIGLGFAWVRCSPLLRPPRNRLYRRSLPTSDVYLRWSLRSTFRRFLAQGSFLCLDATVLRFDPKRKATGALKIGFLATRTQVLTAGFGHLMKVCRIQQRWLPPLKPGSALWNSSEGDHSATSSKGDCSIQNNIVLADRCLRFNLSFIWTFK